MRFHRLANRFDKDLELVEPAARWVDDFLTACAHPQSYADASTHWTRDQLLNFVQCHPGGIDHGDPGIDQWPGYYFWLRLIPSSKPAIPFAGTLSLRIGVDDDLLRYWGHIGYGVFPPARGHAYAERACRLAMPLARRHGMKSLWITTNPDNPASRRTCERLGGTLVETVDVPEGHRLLLKGETRKCRYRIDLR